MKKFLDLLVMNFRKCVLPMIILAVITVVVQVSMYNVALSHDDAYKNYELRKGMASGYAMPVEFLDNDRVDRWNVAGLVSLTAGVLLVCFCGKEKVEHHMVIRNLPVRRSVLWLAKFIQLGLSLALVYLANYAALFIQYIIYQSKVEEEYRALFAFWWNNKVCSTFFGELIALIVLALIISVIYSIKHYSIRRIKEGGK